MKTEKDQSTFPEAQAPEQVSGINTEPSGWRGQNLIVNTPPIVQISDVVTYCGYSISGTFDFTGIPPQYHALLLHILLTRLGYSGKWEPLTKKKEKFSFWQKLKNKFKK